MKLAASSHRNLEAFFRKYLNDDDFCLPVIHFYSGVFTKILTELIGVHGITFGRHIFIKPSLVSLNENGQPQLSKDLAAHEIAHVLQYERAGCIKFLYQYLRDYRKNLRNFEKPDAHSRHLAYLEISFEIEARNIAADFIEWSLFKDNSNAKTQTKQEDF